MGNRRIVVAAKRRTAIKIIIDPGHGGSDPGAVYSDLREKTNCLSIAIRTARFLIGMNHLTYLTRTDDSYVGINERAKFANDHKADLFISIHCNADPDDDSPGKPEAKGSEFWIYPGSVGGRLLAECLQQKMAYFFPDRKFRGIKETTHLGVLRYTNMPAVLIEVGFIDTEESHKLNLFHVQGTIAAAISAAVRQYAEMQ